MNQKIRCRMCGKLQDKEDLDFIEGEYYCTYPYSSEYKTCSEQQCDYIHFLRTRERPE
jgi:hypothetical protein